MEWLFAVEWAEVLRPQLSPLEIVVRGTATYFAIYALLRVVLKREAGAVGVTDLLVMVLIADAAQNAMAADYRSVPDGVLLVAVLIGCDYLLNVAAFSSRRLERWIKPGPLAIVRDGEPLRENMRREFLTEQELRSALRLHGVDDMTRVRLACIEPDGGLSVIGWEQNAQRSNDRRAP